MRGVGKLSSPGKISASFFSSPNVLRVFRSCLEILDLSHPETSVGSIGGLGPGAVCLVSFVRGGIGEDEGEQERKSLGAAMAEEREERKCAVKGDHEDE